MKCSIFSYRFPSLLPRTFSFVVVTVLAIASAANTQAELVGLWRLNELSGPALDSSGNGNAGTFVGTSARTVGMPGFGSAGSFMNDGGNNYVQISPNPGLQIGSLPGESWTMAAWVLEDPRQGTAGRLWLLLLLMTDRLPLI